MPTSGTIPNLSDKEILTVPSAPAWQFSVVLRWAIRPSCQCRLETFRLHLTQESKALQAVQWEVAGGAGWRASVVSKPNYRQIRRSGQEAPLAALLPLAAAQEGGGAPLMADLKVLVPCLTMTKSQLSVDFLDECKCFFELF